MQKVSFCKKKRKKLKIEIEIFFAPGFLLMRQFAVLKGFRIEFQFKIFFFVLSIFGVSVLNFFLFLCNVHRCTRVEKPGRA